MSDAVMVPSAKPDAQTEQFINAQWGFLFGDGPDSFANPGVIHYDEFRSAMLAASTPVGGLGSLADADTHRATEEAVVVPETTVRSYSMPRSGPTGSSVADAVILGFLHGVGRQPWDDMHDYIAVCALDYAFGKPGAREHLSAPPPPSVSTGSRPQEAVPGEGHSAAVVATLITLMDNLVIAQSLSREYRQHATDEARSYLYDLRHQPADGCSSNEGAGK